MSLSNVNRISDEDDEFNPMEYDFNDPKFNSYKSGPGSFISPQLHTQKRWREQGGNIKLFVSNIPLGINKNGFDYLFANFGTPLDTHLVIAKNGQCKWGFVSFKTLKEAERAIYSVNGIPPLNFSVKFAKTDEAKANRDFYKTNANPVNTLEDAQNVKATETPKALPGYGRGRGILPPLNGLKPADMVSTYDSYTPYYPADSQPISQPDSEFSIYSGDETIDIFNESLTYAKPEVKDNYLVVMGRGYAIKELVDQSVRYSPPSQKIFSFTNEDEEVNFPTEPCSVCCEVAHRICFNCSCWYCSKICFRLDSPNHTVDNSGCVICHNAQNNISCGSKENLYKINKHTKVNGVVVKKLIFPPLNESCKNVLTHSDKSKSVDAELSQHKLNDGVNRGKILGNRNLHAANTHYIRQIDELEKVCDIVMTTDSVCSPDADSLNNSSLTTSLLPQDNFTEIKISSMVDDCVYWANKVSDKTHIFDITKFLFKYCQSPKAKCLPSVYTNCECAALHDGFWYRAKVLSCLDQQVRVRLVDYGREELCPSYDLRILPKDEIVHSPPLAFKIRFAEGTHLRHTDLSDLEELSVKPISTENEILIVEVKNEPCPPPSSTDDAASVSSVLFDEGLSFHTFSEVVIAHPVGRAEYWANVSSIMSELIEMTEVLETIRKRFKRATSPILGETYVKLFEHFWCRARVICLEPLKVFYIDYGNEEEIKNPEELYTLPSMFKTHKFHPMAIKIKLSERTSDKYASLQPGSHLNVKPNSKVLDTYIVMVEGEDYSKTTDSKETTGIMKKCSSHQIIEGQLNHLLYIAGDCDSFELVVNQILNNGRICCSLNLRPHCCHPNLDAIEDEISHLLSKPLNNPKLGDMVACLTQRGLSARGYITSLIGDVARVALVDYGFVSAVNKLCNITSSLREIPEAAVFCTFDLPENDIKIQVGSKLKCTQVKRRGYKVCCEIEGFGSCVLSIWRPRVEDGGLSCINIPSRSKVTISAYHTPQAIYVQSADANMKEMFETLVQDVAAQACTAPVLNRNPEIGELVTCLYPEDQNFYRAQVYRKRGDIFSVIFIDFGNTFDVSAADMRILDDRLKMVPCCAVRVGLEGVNESIFTSDALQFLNMKCSRNEPLFLEYEESLKNCELKTSDGISVKNRINSFIQPNWKRCLDEGIDPTNGEVFFASDVKYVRWEVGSKVKILLVTEHTANSYLVINSGDGLLDFMRDKFSPRISQYCNSFSKHYSYTPREREMCLVKPPDDDQWYRACCTRVYQVSCWVVLVDFGNTGEVLFKNVRPMTDEFMQVPSILKKCQIQGLPDEYSNDTVKARLKALLSMGSLHDVLVTKDSLNGNFTAYFSSIAEIYHELGLPPIKSPKF